MDDDDGPSEILDEEYARIATLDAALEVAHGLKKPSSALRFILDQARDDARQAVSDLVSCDPFDGNKVRDLQWKVTRFTDLHDYLAKIMEAGRYATEDLSEDKAAELEAMLRGEEAQPKDT